MKEKEFNKLILSYKDEIAHLVKESNRRRVEHGFLICEKNGHIRKGEKCVGKKCEVTFEPCGEDERVIASFHTHPSGAILPSEGDILHAFAKGEEYICIANTKGNKKGTTRCWKLAEWNDTFKEFVESGLAGEYHIDSKINSIKLLSNDIFKNEGKIIKQTIQFNAME